MKKESMYVPDIALVIAGTFLMAFSISNILEPMELVTGGASGIGIIVKQYTQHWLPFIPEGIPLWFTTLCLNIPLFGLAYFIRGHSFFRRTLLGVGFLTLFLGVMPQLNIITEDTILNIVFGGLIEGCGLGLVFRAMSSTGGSDLVASLLIVKYPFLTVPLITAAVDGLIVLAGMVSFGLEKGLYAIITIFIMEKSSDVILKGFSHNVAVYIISKGHNEIANQINTHLKRGITKIEANGYYRKKKYAYVTLRNQSAAVVIFKGNY